MPRLRFHGGTGSMTSSSTTMRPLVGSDRSRRAGAAAWSCRSRTAPAACRTRRGGSRARRPAPPSARRSACPRPPCALPTAGPAALRSRRLPSSRRPVPATGGPSAPPAARPRGRARPASGTPRRAASTTAAWSPRTGPMNAAPIRAELTNPIASPDARCAMAATESGNTGAMQSTCRKRSTPKLHTWPAAESAARKTEEPTRNHRTARRSPSSSARRGAAIEPSAAAMPVAKMRKPPTSRVDSGATPERRQDLGQDRGQEEDLGGAREHHQRHRHQLPQRGVAARPAAAASRGLPAGTPHAHEGRAAPEHERPQDEREPEAHPRRHQRARRRAPAPGPASCRTGCRTPGAARRRPSAPP